MEVVGAFLHQSGGVLHGILDIGALGGGHGLEHVNSPVHRVAFAQVQRDEVLVNKGELIVKVKQIFVQRAVANNGGGELLAAVHRVVQGKGQGPFPNVHGLVHIVHVIKEEHVGEIGQHTLDEGPVPAGEDHRLTAVLYLAVAFSVRVQPGNGIALGFIKLRKFRDIFVGGFGSFLRSNADLQSRRTGLVIDLPGSKQSLDIVGIGRVINIAECLIAALLVGGSGVALHFGIVRVACKDDGTVHKGVHQYHNHHNNTNRRQDAFHNSDKCIFCHGLTPLSLYFWEGGC